MQAQGAKQPHEEEEPISSLQRSVHNTTPLHAQLQIWSEAQRAKQPHEEGEPISIPQVAEELRLTRRLAGR